MFFFLIFSILVCTICGPKSDTVLRFYNATSEVWSHIRTHVTFTSEINFRHSSVLMGVTPKFVHSGSFLVTVNMEVCSRFSQWRDSDLLYVLQWQFYTSKAWGKTIREKYFSKSHPHLHPPYHLCTNLQASMAHHLINEHVWPPITFVIILLWVHYSTVASSNSILILITFKKQWTATQRNRMWGSVYTWY